ncbi:MAG: glycosyltransferase family 4 protein [Gemmatimonadales bacterium]|nr:glycosyltransferase family 4 protein [Gemmatimonadales bacterium]
MRIAYVVTRSEPIGGAQVHVRDLATAVLARGHQPLVLTGGSGPYVESLRARGVQTFTLASLAVPISPLRDLRALQEIRDLLKTLRPDLISTHSSKAGILGRLAGRTLKVPVIFTAHGWAFTPGVPSREAMVYRWIERLAAPLASRIITVSEFDRQLALARGIAPGDRVVTIHNGMPDIDPELRADPSRSPVRLAMVARFERQKDHMTLFHALTGLMHDPWQLDLIGDGPLLPEAKALSQRLGLLDRIQFWGQRMDVDARLSQVQVALLITNWEGFPRSILEAMRAGLPVVASAVGGIAESVRNGETGFTVPQGDVEALRLRLKQLLDDCQLRVSMGRKARELYERAFTLGHTVDRTLAVYKEVAGVG